MEVEAVKAEQDAQEQHGVLELIEEEEREEAEQAEREEAEQAELQREIDAQKLEQARAKAEWINFYFIEGVDRFVAPSVDVRDLVDTDQGIEKLTPLAMEMGDPPEWVLKLHKEYAPYIKAGLYMGSTVFMAMRAERAVQAAIAEQAKAEQAEAAA